MTGSSKRFEKTTGYIKSQGSRAGPSREATEAGELAITLSRQTGAGAVTLAAGLAEHLSRKIAGPRWEVYHKNLVRRVLEDHGLPPDVEQYMAEDRPRDMRDSVGDMLGLHPPNWELVKHTGETIHKLAAEGRCVIIGRGANIITRKLGNVLRLRLVGSLEEKIIRCQNFYGIDREDAIEFITAQDRARRRYLLAYYDVEIDDPTNYHLVINTDGYSVDELVEFVSEIVETWSSRSPHPAA